MRRLCTFISAYVLTTAAFADIRMQNDSLTEYRNKLCNSPNTTDPPWEVAQHMDGYYATMHYYNETTNNCEELTDSIFSRGPEHGVFFIRYDCLRSCVPGKDSSFCTHPPYNQTNEGEAGAKRAWFYNITSEECHQYRARGNPWKFPKQVNGFGAKGFCENNCARFNRNNVNGSEECDKIVSCTDKPPGLCNDTKEGRRYFYNSTAGECQEYLFCDDMWPSNASAVNYFLTKQLCELSCGQFNSGQPTGSDAALTEAGDSVSSSALVA
ncbi:carboxypeptidase inhibitor SmCI-like [Dermacentor silvarum]|uniref:carboxypeptidase inhibitor SmCI-like n=1 Tax=Dermacentor silvarum TaxID=543639 RepID=UPI002100F513|nr:carboxypeptidase inhibitor SmCI-like [Dermacentor silvarum]